eukprot:scaffold1150_cov152-Amphora_coffeaeformis.AAC.14
MPIKSPTKAREYNRQQKAKVRETKKKEQEEAAERKREQNRLHQQASRARKKAPPSAPSNDNNPTATPLEPNIVAKAPSTALKTPSRQSITETAFTTLSKPLREELRT